MSLCNRRKEKLIPIYYLRHPEIVPISPGAPACIGFEVLFLMAFAEADTVRYKGRWPVEELMRFEAIYVHQPPDCRPMGRG